MGNKKNRPSQGLIDMMNGGYEMKMDEEIINYEPIFDKKSELMHLIKLNRKFESSLKLFYIPESSIIDEESTASIYYSGWTPIEISSYYILKGDFIEIDDDNIDIVVDDIFSKLDECIGESIREYMRHKEIPSDSYEFIKNFDGDKESFKEFKKLVFKFKEDFKK